MGVYYITTVIRDVNSNEFRLDSDPNWIRKMEAKCQKFRDTYIVSFCVTWWMQGLTSSNRAILRGFVEHDRKKKFKEHEKSEIAELPTSCATSGYSHLITFGHIGLWVNGTWNHFRSRRTTAVGLSDHLQSRRTTSGVLSDHSPLGQTTSGTTLVHFRSRRPLPVLYPTTSGHVGPRYHMRSLRVPYDYFRYSIRALPVT